MIILGDVHGDLGEIPTLMIKYDIYERSIIQVGDLGLGFLSKKKDIRNLRILNQIMEEHKCHFYAIRGNHDNPEYWIDEEIESLNNITLVKDNTTKIIEDKKIFFCGGGISIDRLARVKGQSYWENEGVIIDENIIAEVVSADIVITHIAPTKAFPTKFNSIVLEYVGLEKTHGKDLGAELIAERKEIDKLLELKPKQWFYGHYHKCNKEVIDGITFVCVGILDMYNTKTGEFTVDVDNYM